MNQKTRVLIVDDDVAMAKYLASHLARRSFEVTVASGDQEALRIFLSRDPEMIFRVSKLGADEYLSKPIDPKELDIRISRVLENQRLHAEVSQLREQVRQQSDFTMLFGTE